MIAIATVRMHLDHAVLAHGGGALLMAGNTK